MGKKKSSNLGEVLQQHPIWVVGGAVAVAFMAGIGLIETVHVPSLHDHIELLEKQIENLKNQQPVQTTTTPAAEPPSDLAYTVETASKPHKFGSWMNAVVDRLAREGRNEANLILIRVSLSPFKSAYKPFS